MPTASEPSLPSASFDELSPADCRRLAALHVRCLPDSLIARLGRGYTAAFYRYVNRSRREFAFVYREEGQIASACILSLCPHTLDRRLAVCTRLLLCVPLRLFHLPLGGILKSVFRGEQAAAPDTAEESDGALDHTPEVVLLFTAPEAQGRGLAAALLARCEGFLSAQGYHQYLVKTVDDQANLALKFYAKNGFVEHGRLVKYGQQFQVMTKTLVR